MGDDKSSAEKIASAAAIYSYYSKLMHANQEGLGGRLLLVVEAEPHPVPVGSDSPDVEALVRAANIAGAATLLLGSLDRMARERVRSGVCDFLVTTLDEALRILKNELRRKLPAAVCLLCEPSTAACECVERGVQPDLLGFVDQTTQVFAERGAVVVPTQPSILAADATAAGEIASAWRMMCWSAPGQGIGAMLALDTLALSALGKHKQAERRRWLSGAPQFLGRRSDSSHVVPMDEAEATLYMHAVSHALVAKQLASGVCLRYGNEELLLPCVPS